MYLRKFTSRCVSIAIVSAVLPVTAAMAQNVKWTPAAGPNLWSVPGNWSNNAVPTPTNIVTFDDAGAALVPGQVTSRLDSDLTIAGLSFNDAATKYHTADLGGFALTVTGNLDFNTNRNALTTTTIRNGVLNLTEPFALVNVGSSYASGAASIVNLGGLTRLTAGIDQLRVGYSASGAATGELTLPATNILTANFITIGTGGTGGDGALHLGAFNTIVTDNFWIAKNFANGLVDLPHAGSLALGTVARPAFLSIADQNINSGSTTGGTMDLSGGTFDAQLNGLTVGRKLGGAGITNAYLFGGSAGAIHVGQAGNTASIFIGYSVNGGTVSGTVDFSGQSRFDANVNQLLVGSATVGAAYGTLNLPAITNIDALRIAVGEGNGGGGTLLFGRNSTVLTDDLTIGRNYSPGQATIAAGGTLNLGSPTRRTALYIGDGNTNTNANISGKLDLTGSSLNAYLANLIVGRKDGGAGTETGTLLGGNGGSIDIGAPGNTADLLVGYSLNGNVSGLVDFGGLTTLNASLNRLLIAKGGGGNVTLANTNTIDAKTITVGDSGTGILHLGHDTTILTDNFTICRDSSNALVDIPGGGTLRLGSQQRPANLTIASGNTNTNSTTAGKLDMTNAKFIAYLVVHVI